MASASRFSTPPFSPPGGAQEANHPPTPTSNLRNRSQFNRGDESPGSSSSDTASSTNQGILQSSTINLTSLESSGFLKLSENVARRVIVRSDPTIISCFDPSDQELYKLWAPRK